MKINDNEKGKLITNNKGFLKIEVFLPPKIRKKVKLHAHLMTKNREGFKNGRNLKQYHIQYASKELQVNLV